MDRPTLLSTTNTQTVARQADAAEIGSSESLARQPSVHRTKQRLIQILTRDIAAIDQLLSRQVNAIIHHSAFQKLEASWRGLRYLTERVEEGESIKIRMLNVSWRELTRDLERAIEFDQSQLFRKVYGEEFGTAGGEPFGVLLGDYDVRHRVGPDHPTDDIRALESIAQVAAASFAPFLAGADPALLGLDQFSELERTLNLSRTFEQLEYLKWKAFRDSEDARFIGLTLPKVLMRVPYPDDGSRADGFRFHESVEAPDRSQYLWGNAVYAFGSVLVRSFSGSGWLANIRGVERDVVGGGLVTDLVAHSFSTDKTGIAPKCSTDAIITDAQEQELGELGFIPLCHCLDTEFAAFYGNQAVQKSKVYDELPATINAKLSAMLQYMFCVSRFAHYIKVIARDKIGSLRGAKECEEYLHNWLNNYTTSNDDDDMATKASYPLRESRVQIREGAKPGSYVCVVHLRPHYQLDQMISSVRLTTELSPGQAG
jgi:type VI secretion system ImpC/EvpB family protein